MGDGHQVPTAALASSEVLLDEGVVQPAEVYWRDITWIDESDVLVAEISTPSHGVGYEIGYALGLRKPVICLHREGVSVSKMILGNSDPNLQIFTYFTQEEAIQRLRDRLKGVRI
jgi:nucleoside 2-deoxyribosyltransferase